jgi:ferredoxin
MPMTGPALREETAMQVWIVPDGCHGHGLCDAAAPDFFTFDESGYNITPRCAVPAEQTAAVRAAAGNCPEQAIKINDDRSTA